MIRWMNSIVVLVWLVIHLNIDVVIWVVINSWQIVFNRHVMIMNTSVGMVDVLIQWIDVQLCPVVLMIILWSVVMVDVHNHRLNVISMQWMWIDWDVLFMHHTSVTMENVGRIVHNVVLEYHVHPICQWCVQIVNVWRLSTIVQR